MFTICCGCFCRWQPRPDGWALRSTRSDVRERIPSTCHRRTSKGLNFLLNEQPDKAIEVFTHVLEVNSETVETHLALGNLFRRRGEVERAIRIHQNLIARPTLDKEQRSHALLELGQDYLKAGLFDRAENLFLELAEIRLHSEQALRLLLRIYQQEKEWDKAISSARKLARFSGENMNNVVAHYNCELAELAYANKDYSAARAFVREALSSDRKCVRANILLGDIEAEGNRHRDAIKAWKHIEEQGCPFPRRRRREDRGQLPPLRG